VITPFSSAIACRPALVAWAVEPTVPLDDAFSLPVDPDVEGVSDMALVSCGESFEEELADVLEELLVEPMSDVMRPTRLVTSPTTASTTPAMPELVPERLSCDDTCSVSCISALSFVEMVPGDSATEASSAEV
jgi:hypothetical protein